MIYQFEDVTTGELVELDMPMSDAVPGGKVIRRGGRRLRRIYGNPESRVEPDIHFTCYQWAGEEAKGASHYDACGSPIFTSKKEIRSFLRQNPHLEYGDGWSKVTP